MKALVYGGPGVRHWTEVPDPAIKDPEDVIVRVDAVSICGTDLHIVNGDVPEVTPGRVLGHEAVGTVVEIGSGIKSIELGQRVLVSCISSCGNCRFCREGRYGQCLGGGGWILGHTIDGTQAELVRVPFGDRSLYPLPHRITDEAALLLADILPTAYEVGVLAGQVAPGDIVLIVGAGPIGLAALITSKLFSPSRVIVVDPDQCRREEALRLGADAAVSPDADVRGEINYWSHGLGADVAIEAVGLPASFEMCADLVRAGGHVANVGVHGHSAVLHLESLWIRDVTLTTGLVDTRTTPLLMRLMDQGTIDARPLITHRFDLEEMEAAYVAFQDAAHSRTIKVALSSSATSPFA